MTRIVSLNGTSLNDATYSAFWVQSYGIGSRAAVFAGQADGRPAISALTINPRQLPPLTVVIGDGANPAVARRALHQLFLQANTTPKRLIVTDDDGSRERFWDVVVEAFDQVPGTGGMAFVATMRAVDDNAMRSTSLTTQSKTVTSTPDSLVIVNNGDMEAYPIISITPNSAKTNTWRYRRFIRLRWQSAEGASQYPVDVLNGMSTTALVSGGKMQADGRDLRVLVDGVMVEPYISGPNTSTTRAWVALDFSPYPDLQLATAIPSGTISTIDVSDDITGYPDQGLLVIDNEIFAYSSRNTILRQFEGITRATRGSSMATHNVGAMCWLCQHDLWVLYGHGGTLPILAPTQLRRPAFVLAASSNGQWVYDDDGNMGDNVGYRPASWRFNRRYGPSTAIQTYSAAGGLNADPWEVIGLDYDAVRAAAFPGTGEWRLMVPTGVSSINMVGRRYRSEFMSMMTRIFARKQWPYGEVFQAIGPPAGFGTWDTFNQTLTPPAQDNYTETSLLMYVLHGQSPNMLARIEADTITVTLKNGVQVQLATEQEVYSLDVRILNQATDDIIALRHDMPLGATLVVDTETRKVTVNDQSAFSALSMQSKARGAGHRAEWLPLIPGPNTLSFMENGVVSVTWQVQMRQRHIY